MTRIQSEVVKVGDMFPCDRCTNPTPKTTYATRHCPGCAEIIRNERVGNLTATKPIIATATVPQAAIVTTKAVALDIEPQYRSKLEARYAEQLEADRLNGKIRRWRYEAVNLRLAKRTHYRPDFFVVTCDKVIEYHEVKGSWHAPNQAKSRVKLKTAAEMYPEFQFVAVTPAGSGFEYEKI